MSDGDGLWLPARAKLNLVLRVVGRRADGYHLLETLFHALDLHDDLWLARADAGVSLQVSADDAQFAVTAGDDNLVVRALRRLAAACGATAGFDARLHKRIPHGAGLGGGSSDAAAALRLGNQLLGAPLDAVQLARLGSELGADVPFFLGPHSQWGRGVGDELEPATVPPRHFVLVLPPFGCATIDVYKNHAAHWKSGPPQDSVTRVTGPFTRDSAVHTGFCNDLEAAAERVRPELGRLRRRIAALGHPEVRMTGSGSTLFLGCADPVAAAQCAAQLMELAADGVRVLATRSAGDPIDVPMRVAWPPPRPSEGADDPGQGRGRS